MAVQKGQWHGMTGLDEVGASHLRFLRQDVQAVRASVRASPVHNFLIQVVIEKKHGVSDLVST